jgi:hypothetical protein
MKHICPRSTPYAAFILSLAIVLSTVYPNLIIFRGDSQNGLGSVEFNLCDGGKTQGWEYSGEFE